MNTKETHVLGVAPLSALDLPPAQYIRSAKAAGFGAVGLRVAPVTPDEPKFPRDVKSREFLDVLNALEETGLEVLDIEVLAIQPGTGPEQWTPVLELGAMLGATYLNVVGDHPSLADFADIVGQLTTDAHAHGLQPILEPVAFRPLNSFDTAVRIARETGCAVELDVLHFLRTGASLSTITDNQDLFPVLQICDAPAELAGHGGALLPLSSSGTLADLMIAEARARRMLPGDGDAPIRELLEALPDAPRISVEIPNPELRDGLPAGDYLRLLREAVALYLEASPSASAKGIPRHPIS